MDIPDSLTLTRLYAEGFLPRLGLQDNGFIQQRLSHKEEEIIFGCMREELTLRQVGRVLFRLGFYQGDSTIRNRMRAIGNAVERFVTGVAPPRSGWALPENQLLAKLWHDDTIKLEGIAEKVGRPAHSCSTQARRLNLGYRPKLAWRKPTPIDFGQKGLGSGHTAEEQQPQILPPVQVGSTE